MKTAEQLLAGDFATISDLVAAHAHHTPDKSACTDRDRTYTYGQLNALIDRAAATLQQKNVKVGDCIAICGPSSIEYVAIFMAALRAGVAASPLSPSALPAQLQGMLNDCGAKFLFTDDATAELIRSAGDLPNIEFIGLEGENLTSFKDWLLDGDATPTPVEIDPKSAFNIIYSSGTTGTPKGIVQSHMMRWGHVRRADTLGYGPQSITLASTPLYSNTTLVSVFPTLARGGELVLMRKFDARDFLELAQKHKATHAMLVPVQYRRIMDIEDFDSFDLSAFQMKTSTSAPFAADLKADVLTRWPGGLVEIYGMTEGGGTCVLAAHLHPTKLHTVGQPAEGHEIRIIDENGKELPRGETGEVVGRSMAMMNGYHNQPKKTSDAEWYSPEGDRYIRTGDVAYYDEDGFIVLGDRMKDMIISGGFNIYPSDLEAEFVKHDRVSEVAVVGIPSREWGETPAAFVVLNDGPAVDGEELRVWANEKLGKMQRVRYVEFMDALPRSSIGKVLKRELRDNFTPPKG